MCQNERQHQTAKEARPALLDPEGQKLERGEGGRPPHPTVAQGLPLAVKPGFKIAQAQAV